MKVRNNIHGYFLVHMWGGDSDQIEQEVVAELANVLHELKATGYNL